MEIRYGGHHFDRWAAVNVTQSAVLAVRNLLHMIDDGAMMTRSKGVLKRWIQCSHDIIAIKTIQQLFENLKLRLCKQESYSSMPMLS